MLELLESLSLASGTFVVAGFSVIFALFYGRLDNSFARWAAVVAASALLAYTLYWAPVWLGADASEYSTWSLALIIPWSLVGALASTPVVIVVRKYVNTKRSRDA